MTDQAAATLTSPRITPQTLIDTLREDGLLDDRQLAALLGKDRNNPTLSRLESALVSSSTLSSARLGQVKQTLSGIEAVLDAAVPVSSDLPAAVARPACAVQLARPSSSGRPVVVFLDDSHEHRNLVEQHFGGPVEPRIAAFDVFAQLMQAAYTNTSGPVHPQVADIYTCLDMAIEWGASDMHLRVGQPPIYEVDGELRAADYQALSADWMHAQLAEIAGPQRFAQLVGDDHDVDLAVGHGGTRFRVNLGQDRHGLTLVARQLPSEIRSPEDLGLPPAVVEFTKLDRGLVLITGPTGSGKTTTLAALLARITESRPAHLLTLEDPIEYVLPDSRDGKARGLVTQREKGRDFASFAGGLRQALRQKPEVILVGEMRDPETMSVALTAAETGHLVFATLHTHDAVSTVQRIVSMYPGNEQSQIRSALATVLQGVVSQKLIPRIGGGRVAALEVMVVNPAIRANLRTEEGGANLKLAISGGRDVGMQTMDIALAELVRTGKVTRSDAEARCVDLNDFRNRVNA